MKRIYLVGFFIADSLETDSVISCLHIEEELIYSTCTFWNDVAVWNEVSLIKDKDRYHNDFVYNKWLKRYWKD